ncbi:MAG: hypothetical protein AB9819_00620 [Methanomassiliicoccales archaeon]
MSGRYQRIILLFFGLIIILYFSLIQDGFFLIVLLSLIFSFLLGWFTLELVCVYEDRKKKSESSNDISTNQQDHPSYGDSNYYATWSSVRYNPPTNLVNDSITDRQNQDQLGKPTGNILSSVGWSSTLSELERESAIDRSVKRYGKGDTIKALQYVQNMHRYNQHVFEKCKHDLSYLKSKRKY